MNILYIPTTYNKEIVLTEVLVEQLPQTIILFTTSQYITQLENIKKQLENQGTTVKIVKTRNTRYPGQLYGCNLEEIKENCDAFLFIGDGEFHPKALLLGNNKPVITYDPNTKQINNYDQELVKKIRKQRQAARSTFQISKNIGVLVTTKPGQNHYNKAQELPTKYPDKTFTFILNNTIDFQSLEDFTFIDCWINTACPRIIDDQEKIRKPIINLFDVLER